MEGHERQSAQSTKLIDKKKQTANNLSQVKEDKDNFPYVTLKDVVGL